MTETIAMDAVDKAKLSISEAIKTLNKSNNPKAWEAQYRLHKVLEVLESKQTLKPVQLAG